MTDNNQKDPWLGEPVSQQSGDGGAAIRSDSSGQRLEDRLLRELLAEQRRKRRWGVFFKSLGFIYLFALLFALWPGGETGDGVVLGRHTALVEIRGIIADDAEANADDIIAGLRAAFRNSNTAAVILRINSPGGSPVQAGYVVDEIRRLKKEHPDIHVYSVITDMCASGGYYIASAADEIYADKASIVGSIGVLMNGFGFVDAMKKLGIERRLLTAGEHKGFLDPFSPLADSDRQHIQKMLDNIHQQFIDVVRKGRGDRLKENGQLFSGLVWTGQESLDMGLIDGLGSSSYVAREVIGAEKIVDYTYRQPYFERMIERFGTTMGTAMAHALSPRIE